MESILDLKDQMSFYPPVGFDAKQQSVRDQVKKIERFIAKEFPVNT